MLWSEVRDKITFTSLHRKVLADIPIDPQTHPILRDFPALLDYVRRERPALTKGGQLPMAVLEPINGLLSRPIEHGLQRPSQKSFPHINGLYLLLRASGLTLPVADGKKMNLAVDEELAEIWAGLTAVEQYLGLIEIWFLRAKPEIIDPTSSGSGHARFSQLPEMLRLVAEIPAAGLSITKDDEMGDRLRFLLGYHHLALMELFGLLQIEPEPPQPGQGWTPAYLKLTPFGKAFAALLVHELWLKNKELWVDLFIREQILPGALKPIFQPYYPDWQRVLELPKHTFKPGVYHFKVSLGRIWRRIAIVADDDLDSLAWTILSSVNFDGDHLYQFSFRNRLGVSERINHPYMDEGPWTDEYRIGDLPLTVGQSMTFLFDFGDNWEFDLLLEKIDENEALKEAAVIEFHGEPPKQYRSW